MLENEQNDRRADGWKLDERDLVFKINLQVENIKGNGVHR